MNFTLFLSLNLTFPKNNNFPSGLFQFSFLFNISCYVFFKFTLPKLTISIWYPCGFASWVLMPKATMNEYYGFVLGKNDI